MSPKRQVNHNIRKHFNTIIYNISRYAEIALSMVILLVIALAGFRLIMEVADTSIMSMDTEFFSTFLSQDRKSTRLNSSHTQKSRMPSSA